MKKLIVVTFVLAVAGLLTVTVYGQGGPIAAQPRLLEDGRIAIDRPMTITEPGSYVVTRNIMANNGSALITITADDVDLDLAGFVVSGLVAVVVEDAKAVSIHDGSLVGDSDGETLRLHNVTGFAIRRLFIRGFAEDAIEIGGSSTGTIEDCVVSGADRGIEVWSSGVVIKNNHVSSCGNGIRVGGNKCTIQGNTLIGNSGFGLKILGDGNVYRGNMARGNNGGAGDPCDGTASGGDFCDEGTNNTSHGDNYMPGQM